MPEAPRAAVTLTYCPSELFNRVASSSVSALAPATGRVYRGRLEQFRRTVQGAQTGQLDRETVSAYIRQLSLAGASPQVLNQSIAAIKRFCAEAAELGWIDERTSAAIGRIKTRRSKGIRTGRWLTLDQVKSLIASIDRTTTIGQRDAALIALLIGCGLRRFEAVGLTAEQFVRSADDRQATLRNIAGKGNRTRTIAVPIWAERLISDWIERENRENERVNRD